MDRAVLIPEPDVTQAAPHGREFDDDSHWKRTFGDSLQGKLALASPTATHGHGKAAGWVIVAFPVVSSLVLWSAIVLSFKLFS